MDKVEAFAVRFSHVHPMYYIGASAEEFEVLEIELNRNPHLFDPDGCEHWCGVCGCEEGAVCFFVEYGKTLNPCKLCPKGECTYR